MTSTVYLFVVALSLSPLGCLIYHSRANLTLYSGKKNFLEILIHQPGFLRAGHIRGENGVPIYDCFVSITDDFLMSETQQHIIITCLSILLTI